MLREIPTNDNLILSTKTQKIQKCRVPKHMSSAKPTQAQLKHIWGKAAWGAIRFYPTVRILTAMLREIPTNDNLILSTKSEKIQKRRVPKHMASAKPTQAQLKHIWGKAAWGAMRFYPTVRILTAMLREIPTNDNLILSTKSEKIQKRRVMASAKPTQAQLKHIWGKTAWGAMRFYPTVRILTAMFREIPTNDDLILSTKNHPKSSLCQCIEQVYWRSGCEQQGSSRGGLFSAKLRNSQDSVRSVRVVSQCGFLSL